MFENQKDMNKRHFSLLPALLFIFLPSGKKQSTGHIDDGLVAWYSFDSCDARDDSGNGSDGKMYGTVECWCGVKNDGLLLDGKNDYIVFEGLVNRYFNTSDFTISFYFRPTGKTLFKQSLLSKRADCGDSLMLDIKILDTEIDVDFHETESKDFPGLSTYLEGNQWYHYTLVREGTQSFSYINGGLRQKSRRCSGVDISNDAPLSIGNSPCLGGGIRRFRGVIDELRVYDRALPEEEVMQLYDENPIEQAQQDCFS